MRGALQECRTVRHDRLHFLRHVEQPRSTKSSRSLGNADLYAIISDHRQLLFHSMNVLKFFHVTPAWVQIGNEINSGICHPVGSLSTPAR